MKPDLSQSDFARLVQRSEQLRKRTRVGLGMDQQGDASGTPFDRMLQVLGRGFALLCAAVLLVLLIALAFQGGPKP
jgi:hypothetical protein